MVSCLDLQFPSPPKLEQDLQGRLGDFPPSLVICTVFPRLDPPTAWQQQIIRWVTHRVLKARKNLCSVSRV